MTDKKYGYPEKIYLFPAEYRLNGQPDLVWCETDESDEEDLAQQYVKAESYASLQKKVSDLEEHNERLVKAVEGLKLNPKSPRIKLDLSDLSDEQYGSFVDNLDYSYYTSLLVEEETGENYFGPKKDLVVLMSRINNPDRQVILEFNPDVFKDECEDQVQEVPNECDAI